MCPEWTIRREQQVQDLCFSSRPFVLCGLPIRRLPKEQLLYERGNGQFTLQITGHPQFVVPFGQDRFVPIFLATLAVQQKSRKLRFRTAAEMLEALACTRAERVRRLVAAFERIFASSTRQNGFISARWYALPPLPPVVPAAC